MLFCMVRLPGGLGTHEARYPFEQVPSLVDFDPPPFFCLPLPPLPPWLTGNRFGPMSYCDPIQPMTASARHPIRIFRCEAQQRGAHQLGLAPPQSPPRPRDAALCCRNHRARLRSTDLPLCCSAALLLYRSTVLLIYSASTGTTDRLASRA